MNIARGSKPEHFFPERFASYRTATKSFIIKIKTFVSNKILLEQLHFWTTGSSAALVSSVSFERETLAENRRDFAGTRLRQTVGQKEGSQTFHCERRHVISSCERVCWHWYNRPRFRWNHFGSVRLSYQLGCKRKQFTAWLAVSRRWGSTLSRSVCRSVCTTWRPQLSKWLARIDFLVRTGTDLATCSNWLGWSSAADLFELRGTWFKCMERSFPYFDSCASLKLSVIVAQSSYEHGRNFRPIVGLTV